jgi:anthranilate phosphoribosyltransferase
MNAPTTAGAPTWGGVISSLIARQDLGRAEAEWAMNEIMSGQASSAQIAGFVVALRGKGETVDELSGLADVMLRHAIRIEVPGPAVDIVGTGGDRLHTVNISTMAALVVAGAGYRVVKHGNRAASSLAGSADVLEALGVRLDLSPERVAELATEVGITFCFARAFHPAMRHVGVTRAELGVATVFNFLGPLTNPAQPGALAVGVPDARMAPLMAGVYASRGASALVFRGDEGLDELSTASPSTVWLTAGGVVTTERFDPASIGIPAATIADLRGGDVAFNADVVRATLDGVRGPVRDAVLLNAAGALVAAGAVTSAGPVGERIAAAIPLAEESVDSGNAAKALDAWVTASRS